MFCASVGLRLVLKGRTAHASQPETGISPAQTLADLIRDLAALGPGGAMDEEFALVTITYARLGEPRTAIEHYEQALKISREIGYRRGEANNHWNMSLAQDSLGKRSDAVGLAKEALAIYEQIESLYAERVRQQLAEWQQ